MQYRNNRFAMINVVVERMRKSRVEEQISVNKPDIVIEQRAERFLPFTPNTGLRYSCRK